MSAKNAKEQGFTNIGVMYGINGYVKFDNEGMEFRAKWLLTDYIHEAITYLDSIIGFSPNGFKCLVGDKI